MTKIELPSLLEMLKSGVHFGHQTSRWHPKMKPFIFTSRNDIHIIDLEQTKKYLRTALDYIYNVTAGGEEVLLVGTKKQIKDIVKEAAKVAESPVVIDKWVGGTFTNYKTIFKLIKKLEKLEKQKAKGGWDRYTKKEQLNLQKEYDNLLFKVGGIRQLTKLPKAIFVVDIKEEKTAVNEARKKGIPIVAICDSNVDPSKVDYPIPGNDDAVKAVSMMLDLVARTIKAGKEEFAKNSPAVAAIKPESTTGSQESKK